MIKSCDIAEPGTTHAQHNVFTSFEEAEYLKNDWDELACRTGDIFCSFDWCRTWWRYFGTGRTLEIHSLHQDTKLVGVLPLFREVLLTGLVCLHVVRLVAGDYASDAAGLAVDSGAVEPFFQRVLASLSERGPWDILHLGPLRSYNTITEQIATVCAATPAVGTAIHGCCDNWLTLYDLQPRYDDYLQSLSKHDRHDTSRRERRLREAYQVSVSMAETVAEVQEGMDALINLHQKLWTGKGESGHFGQWPELAQFHSDVAQEALTSGHLTLLTLKADDQVLGAALSYRFGTRTHGLIRGYRNDGPWRGFSLGRMLHCNIIKQAIEQGSCVLESGRGLFDYKLRLGGKLYGERSVTIVRRSAMSSVRVWVSLRVAYGIHVLYGRIWLDRLAPKLGLHPKVSHAFVRRGFLAQLYRRTKLGLFGNASLLHAKCLTPEPGGESE